MAPPGTRQLVLAVGGSWSLESVDGRLDVREVDDGAAALDALESVPVDCVVADLHLPEQDGIALCDSIREHDRELPVLLCVDDRGDLGDRAVDALDAGVTRVIEPAEDVASIVETEIERYRELRARARHSEMFESVLRQIPLSVYVKDERGVIEAASDSMVPEGSEDYIVNEEGKVHQHADDLIGKTDYDLFEQSHAENAIADDRTVVEREEPIVDEIEEVRDPWGESLYYSTSKAPRYEDGEVVGVVGASLNVTERVENRREVERQNEQLDQFASALSHDLRNPLSVAMGYLESLEERHDDERIDECRTSLERIQSLTEDLLTYAREGQRVVETDAVELDAVSRDAWANVDTGDATLAVETDRPIEADPDRLQRLLENLFRNAVEHGSTSPRSQAREDAVEHGTPRDAHADGDGEPDDAAITEGDDAAIADGDGRATADGDGGVTADDEQLTVRVADDGPDFYVADDGAGFGELDPEAAFERGQTTNEFGTGFGLAIVQNIANAHGWAVDARERDGGGARFDFTRVVRSDPAETATA